MPFRAALRARARPNAPAPRIPIEYSDGLLKDTEMHDCSSKIACATAVLRQVEWKPNESSLIRIKRRNRRKSTIHGNSLDDPISLLHFSRSPSITPFISFSPIRSQTDQSGQSERSGK
jgi:hypothetical protein